MRLGSSKSFFLALLIAGIVGTRTHGDEDGPGRLFRFTAATLARLSDGQTLEASQAATVLTIPDHAQGAAIGGGRLWIARSDWNWGTLAERVCAEIGEKFRVDIDGFRDTPVGPAAPRPRRSGKFRAHKEPDLSTELRHDRFATTAPCVVSEPRFCPGDTTVANDNRKRGNASGVRNRFPSGQLRGNIERGFVMRKRAPSSPRHRRGSRRALDAEGRRNKVANNQVDRVLAQDRLEATQDYVRRGRHLEHLDTDALKQHWITALTSFFHDRSPERMRGLDDATSELGLRGLSPDALVPSEIWAAMQAEIAQDRDDPEALAAVEKRIRELLSKEGSRH
jgi:hypothetical protein